MVIVFFVYVKYLTRVQWLIPSNCIVTMWVLRSLYSHDLNSDLEPLVKLGETRVITRWYDNRLIKPMVERLKKKYDRNLGRTPKSSLPLSTPYIALTSPSFPPPTLRIVKINLTTSTDRLHVPSHHPLQPQRHHQEPQ